MKSVIINLQIACKKKILIKKKTLQKWLEIFLPEFQKKTEITIRIVEKKEIQYLNMKYRGKNKPTNILSFPFIVPKKIYSPLIGDLVICQKIVQEEALLQKKNISTHYAHLIVHGCLHLFGYKHKKNRDFKKMKKKETKIMKKIGYKIF